MVLDLGGAALSLEIFQGAPLADVAAKDSSLALFAMLQQLPLATLTSIIGTLLVVVFFVTRAIRPRWCWPP